MIKQYIRNKKNQKIGVLVGSMVPSGEVLIGFSKVNMSAGDTFNRDLGIHIATERIRRYDEHNKINVPPKSIEHNIDRFVTRCQKYFKTEHVEVI